MKHKENDQVMGEIDDKESSCKKAYDKKEKNTTIDGRNGRKKERKEKNNQERKEREHVRREGGREEGKVGSWVGRGGKGREEKEE